MNSSLRFALALALIGFAGTVRAQTNWPVPVESPRPAKLADVRLRDCCVWADTNTLTYYLVSSTGRRGTNGRSAVIEYTSKDLENSGKLIMVWSSFGAGGYTVGVAVSKSGKLAGPWEQQAQPLFAEDGGHPMLFHRFNGQLMMILHQPNHALNERARLFEVEDTGDTIRLKDR